MYSSLSPKELPQSCCRASYCRCCFDQANTARLHVTSRTVIQATTLPGLPSAISATVWLLIILLFVLVLGQPARGQSKETTLAVVNDKSISQGEVDQAIASQLLPLEQQIYALRKAALENLITRAILEAEASRLGITLEDLRKRLSIGPVIVFDREVEKLYQENALVFAAMSPDEAREKLRLDLEAQARMHLYREALAKLKAAAKINVLLEEPRLRFFAADDVAPSKGPDDAPVIITEFSDFQCPYCKEFHGTLNKILQAFPKQIRLRFKHLPLEMHPQAFSSAQAAFCAGKQGKFWQYHDALFAANSISPEAFIRIASGLRLDESAFRACVADESSGAAVRSDMQEAKKIGVNETPTLFINGKLVRGAIPLENLKAIIERELDASKRFERTVQR